MPNTGWRTRGYLPHYDQRGLIQHVVFCLRDSFFASLAAPESPNERLDWADRQLDAGYGALLLKSHANAIIVEECLLHGHGSHYALAAWCVMPNHVHVVVEQRDTPLANVVQSWKSVTAHAINKREGRRGALWQREYFDRFMRSEEQYDSTVRYVEENPVSAGLISEARDWRFSSAWAERTW